MFIRKSSTDLAQSVMSMEEIEPTLSQCAHWLSVNQDELEIKNLGWDARTAWNTYSISVYGVEVALCNELPTEKGIAPIPQDELDFYASSKITHIRRLHDGTIVGLCNMFSTVALMVGISPTTMCTRRYCYPFVHERHVEEALAMFTDSTQHAIGPWVKCKGVMNGRMIDALNPNIESI